MVPSGARAGAAEDEFRAALARFGEHVRALETYVRDTEISQKKLIKSAERQLELARADTTREEVAEALDIAVEELHTMEQRLAEVWLPEIRRSEANRKKALRSRHVLQRGLYADLLRRGADAMATALERLRDARLELAALAAELDAHVDSPVFDDPDELKKYLETV